MREHWRAWRFAGRKLGLYNLVDDAELSARKTSHRVFIFGSGFSINDITDSEWNQIQRHDTIGFNGTYYLHKIPITYFVLRAGMETVEGNLSWEGDVNEIVGAIDDNRFLDDSVFFFQRGFEALFCNRLLGFERWRKQRPLRRFVSDKVSRLPSLNANRLVHRAGTLCTAINLGIALGYREIVLVGVDLYDSRYFWLPPEKTMGWDPALQKWAPTNQTFHGSEPFQSHNTVRNGVVDIIAKWDRFLAKTSGARIMVYNPKSLLAERIPVFRL